MRDMRADRSPGTAPLPADVAPSPAQRQHVAPDDVAKATIRADAQDVRSVKTMAQAGSVSFGDPVADAMSQGAENLATAVLESGDRGLIDKVKAKLGHASDDELRDIARGKPLTDAQKDKLDPHEKGMLLDACTDQGAKAALDALKSRSDSG